MCTAQVASRSSWPPTICTTYQWQFNNSWIISFITTITSITVINSLLRNLHLSKQLLKFCFANEMKYAFCGDARSENFFFSSRIAAWYFIPRYARYTLLAVTIKPNVCTFIGKRAARYRIRSAVNVVESFSNYKCQCVSSQSVNSGQCTSCYSNQPSRSVWERRWEWQERSQSTRETPSASSLFAFAPSAIGITTREAQVCLRQWKIT